MRKLLHIFLSIFIVYASTQSAYANTSLGGWTVTDSVIAGVNTTINATKSSASGALKSAITVAPNALKVGGFLLRGGAVGALALAIPQLIGEGVDYVLDPANNTVTYTDPNAKPAGGATTSEWFGSYNFVTYYNADAFCAAWNAKRTPPYPGLYGVLYVISSTRAQFKCYDSVGNRTYIDVSRNAAYDPTVSTEVNKSIPIADVATKVIANAEAGHPESQDAVKAAALEGFVAGDYDADLEAAAVPYAAADPASLAAADASNTSLTGISAILASILSAFTGFADWLKAQWSEFVLTFTALNDWLFEESPATDTDNTITPSIPPVVPAQVAIDFVGGCPAPLGFDFDFYGRSYRPSIPFTPICDVAILINPIIKICATIAAAYIVAGIRQGSN